MVDFYTLVLANSHSSAHSLIHKSSGPPRREKRYTIKVLKIEPNTTRL